MEDKDRKAGVPISLLDGRYSIASAFLQAPALEIKAKIARRASSVTDMSSFSAKASALAQSAAIMPIERQII